MSLTSTNSDGSDSEIKNNFITVVAPLIPGNIAVSSSVLNF